MTVAKTQTRSVLAVKAPAHAVLDALAQTPDLSQRELAQHTGLSLTKAHFVLKELIQQRLVRVSSSGRSSHRLGYLYHLTEAGRGLHTRLSYQALSQAVQNARRIVRGFRATISELCAGGLGEVALLGDGPLREAVREVIDDDGRLSVVDLDRAAAVLVCDPEAEAGYRGAARLVRLTGALRAP